MIPKSDQIEAVIANLMALEKLLDSYESLEMD
jgi:hypothetical protein